MKYDSYMDGSALDSIHAVFLVQPAMQTTTLMDDLCSLLRCTVFFYLTVLLSSKEKSTKQSLLLVTLSYVTVYLVWRMPYRKCHIGLHGMFQNRLVYIERTVGEVIKLMFSMAKI